MNITSIKKYTGLFVLCLALALCLSPPAWAELCPHHTEHTDCGYAEAVPETPCGHVCGESCGDGCTHSHDEACGYSAGRPEFPCLYICAECLAEKLPETPGDGDGGDSGGTEAPPADGDSGDAPGGEQPYPGAKTPLVSDVSLTRKQYDTRLLSIDESGNLVFGELVIPPMATDPDSGAYVPGRFSWGDGGAPIVILNEPGTASYPLFFVPNDLLNYGAAALSLHVVTEAYSPGASLPIGYIAMMMSSSTGITQCSIAVSSDCDTVYLDGMISKFRTSLKPLSGQELGRLLAVKSRSGNITIDATYSGYRVDNIQLSAYTLSSFMDAMRDEETGLRTLTVKLSGGSVTLDLAALESLCTNGSCSSVRLAIDRDVGTFPLNEAQKEALRPLNVRLVSRVYFDCQRREKPEGNYGEGTMDISIPFYYGDITLCAIDEDGKLTELEKSFENMELKFSVSKGVYFVLVK